MKILLIEGIRKVTSDDWAKCVAHVREKVEHDFWRVDELIDDAIERIVINIGEGDSDSEDESEDGL